MEVPDVCHYRKGGHNNNNRGCQQNVIPIIAPKLQVGSGLNQQLQWSQAGPNYRICSNIILKSSLALTLQVFNNVIGHNLSRLRMSQF